MIKGAKSIAEYAIRKWLEVHEFDMSQFELTITVMLNADGQGRRLYLTRV